MTQTFFPGTEPPHNLDIERALSAWWTAKADQKRAAADTKLKHAAAMLHIQHAGLEAYPWTNPDTGRKRTIVVTREPKLKETRAPRASRRGGDAELGEDVAERKARRKKREEDKIEVKRVPRASVEKELDPFAATRGAMAETYAGDGPLADKAKKAATKPKAKRKR